MFSRLACRAWLGTRALSLFAWTMRTRGCASLRLTWLPASPTMVTVIGITTPSTADCDFSATAQSKTTML